jgi:hypothetical protein
VFPPGASRGSWRHPIGRSAVATLLSAQRNPQDRPGVSAVPGWPLTVTLASIPVACADVTRYFSGAPGSSGIENGSRCPAVVACLCARRGLFCPVADPWKTTVEGWVVQRAVTHRDAPTRRAPGEVPAPPHACPEAHCRCRTWAIARTMGNRSGTRRLRWPPRWPPTRS